MVDTLFFLVLLFIWMNNHKKWIIKLRKTYYFFLKTLILVFCLLFSHFQGLILRYFLWIMGNVTRWRQIRPTYYIGRKRKYVKRKGKYKHFNALNFRKLLKHIKLFLLLNTTSSLFTRKCDNRKNQTVRIIVLSRTSLKQFASSIQLIIINFIVKIKKQKTTPFSYNLIRV